MVLTKIICISIQQIMPKLSLKLAIIYARLSSCLKIADLTLIDLTKSKQTKEHWICALKK